MRRSIENACHCIAVLLLLGVPVRAFRPRLKQLEPIDMRLSWKPGVNRCAVLDDSYSNDPASLRIALQAARQQWRDGRITLILSDFLQAGANKRRLYASVARLLRDYRIDRLIAVGSEVQLLEEQLSAVMSVAAYPDTDALLNDLSRFDFHDELIVVKGARTFALERVVRRLEQRAHRTVLEVSLDAVAHNLGVFSRYTVPGTKIMVMLKAAVTAAAQWNWGACWLSTEWITSEWPTPVRALSFGRGKYVCPFWCSIRSVGI
jgi:UDP-N-acetylmuramyl pentapeptide synthase